MFYVYILKSKKDESLYIGYTNDLKRRFDEHNKGQSRFTKFKIPLELIYYEAYKSQSDAKHREKMLKRFASGYKELKKRIFNSMRAGKGD
jgi:putative endonuclease